MVTPESARQEALNALRDALDDPAVLKEVLHYVFQRNAAEVYESSAEFFALGQLHNLIRESSPKIRTWMARSANADTIGNVCDQFITTAVATARAFESDMKDASIGAIDCIERNLLAKNVSESLAEDIKHLCDVQRHETLGEFSKAGRSFVGSVKKVAHSVKDTTTLAIENVALRSEQ